MNNLLRQRLSSEVRDVLEGFRNQSETKECLEESVNYDSSEGPQMEESSWR